MNRLMAQLVRCKACGYILEKNQLKDACPACGAKKEAFEEYTPNISEQRWKILNFHIHPIVVHFAQAFGPLLILLGAAIFLFESIFGVPILLIMRFLALIYPFTVLFAIPSGVLDGKTRFKKITSILKTKLIIGIIFLILTVLIAVIAIPMPLEPYSIENNSIQFWGIFVLSILTFFCEGLLGKIGGSLVCAKMP